MWGTLDIIFYFGLCWPQLAGYIATGQWLAEACDAIVDRTGFFSELCICWTRPIGAVLLFPTLSHGLGRRAGGELALSLSLSLAGVLPDLFSAVQCSSSSKGYISSCWLPQSCRHCLFNKSSLRQVSVLGKLLHFALWGPISIQSLLSHSFGIFL